ncbi:putative Tat-binding-like protein [Clavispora lusitaniae]|uniref:Tat-binding-like protein n=1 Tax=Clavispora lusitaniae TaxID=36911 RepID=A0AA91PVR0_CLALS|nr:putative Tat-binding-like protein [Clavispora lusitaniae]
MARSTRRSRVVSSSDNEDSSARRSRRNVSYVEESDDENGLLGDAEEPADELASIPSGNDKPAQDDNYDEDFSESEPEVMPKRKRRKRSSRAERGRNSDDSDFQDIGDSEEDQISDAYDEDDAFMEKLREKQFIASEDDDEQAGSSYFSTRRRRAKSRSRSTDPKPSRRLTRANETGAEADDEEGEEDSINQEIQDLYDSSPDQSPVKHKLREREKIDYTIPPPITNDTELYAGVPTSQSFRSRGKKNNSKSDFRKLLFPTAGPFGGSDVISILGQNIPPGGIPIPGMTAENSGPVHFNNDSDSSDDDFTPVAGTLSAPSASNFGPTNNMVNHTKIIGASSSTDKKKKNTLSDTDPLGVDMNIDFSSVGGLDNYIDQLKEMVALPLLYPELYQNFSITPPRGVLFHGPPGTGKTLMARALAASCSTPSRKITFFMRKGADCLSKWVGEAERQLRLLFEEAKNQQPSIIFFDEIDGLAPVRSSKQEQIHASIVSTLLALMDGMDNRGQVIVIGATNRPDSVDPALRRPGRFDREFYFPLPDIEARKQILNIHTRKWTPPLPPVFIEKVAKLTKGYGGADLRALCTEAALNSIQRKYPQIYQSSDKLKVDPSKVKVIAKDFMRAIDKIVPSSARSSSTGSSPLPERLQPLLQESLDKIINRLADLLPDAVGVGRQKRLTNLEEAKYLDPTIKDSDGGFSKHELLKSLESSRICKPHLLICGEKGSGQQYLGAAVLNVLEGFQVQNLDLATMFGDVTRTPESCIVQTFIEARRHQPSIIFIPNIDTWFNVMPQSAKAVLSGLLRNLRSDEKILLLGIAERSYEELDVEIKMTLGFSGDSNNVALTNPTAEARKTFFVSVEKALLMKPYEFLNDLENRPKRRLKQLPVVPPESTPTNDLSRKRQKQQDYQDKRLKNMLKIKLAGLMDLFKNRYKRFKKPIVDDSLLHHLFEPSVLENPMYEVAYVIEDTPEHPNMIKELATGKYFYNMDLDTIEERIWNGYYSEAKQFLKDIRMIVKDAISTGDRERILKANEMLTNAQFGIDDFNNPEFAAECKALRAREIEKQKKLVSEYEKLKEEFAKKQEANLRSLENDPSILNGHAAEAELKLLEHPYDASIHEKVGNGPKVSNGSVDAKDDQEHRNGEDEKAGEEKEEGIKTDNDSFMVITPPHEASKDDENEPVPASANAEANMGANAMNDVENTAETVDESESEAEVEDQIHPTRELIVPEETKKLFEEIMINETEGFTVEQLEHFVARLMEVIWADRGKWDKTGTVAMLKEVIKHI